MNVKDIVIEKTHESSLKSLNKESIPSKVLDYLTIPFLNSVASSLSAITKNTFLYTGKIASGDKHIKVAFVASNQTDTIDMVIRYNYTDKEGFEFTNLNDHLEEAISEDSVIEEIIKQPVEKKAPNLGNIMDILDEQIEEGEKEIKKNEINKLKDAMDGAVKKAEIKDKLTGILESLEKDA